MIRNSEILVVDPDPTARSLALRALRKDGLRAIGAGTRHEALQAFEAARPMVVISELALDEGDGLSLMRELREVGGHEVPVLLLSDLTGAPRTAGADARALGAEDLLPKPLFARDLVTFSHLHRGRPAGARVIEGRLEQTSAAYLLRALATGSRSGRVVFIEGEGEVVFREGRIIEASFRHRCGEPALFRLLTLQRGPFHLFFETIGKSGSLNLGVKEILRQGLPYVQRWEAITGRLPGLDAVLQIDFGELGAKLATLPDAVNGIVRLFDGKRDLERVLTDSPLAELTTLEVIDRLLHGGILVAPVVEAAPVSEEASPAPEAPVASDEVMRSLFGEGLPAGVAGAAALGNEVPAGWTAGEPIAWSALEPEPVIGRSDEAEDPRAITGWDLPAALAEASRVAHAHALEQSADLAAEASGEATLAAAADLGELGDLGDLGEALAPDFFEDEEVPTPALEASEDEAELEELYHAMAVGTRKASLGWAAWTGFVALCGSLIVATVVLTLDEVRVDPEVASPAVVRAVSPEPAAAPAPAPDPAVAADLALVEAEAEGSAAAPVPKDDAWLAAELQAASDAYATGLYGDAVLIYAGAAIERRDSLEARMGLGLSYLELGDLEGAVGAFRAAREIDPSSPRALALLGSALQISGQRMEARKVYQRYLEVRPEGTQASEIRAILDRWDD
ncbi:MAG: response regulator [Deltaproteobacteria bacterium]|nr:response regulator [Deltaproteobacteria bacterium]